MNVETYLTGFADGVIAAQKPRSPFGLACLGCRQRPAVRVDALCFGCGIEADTEVCECGGRDDHGCPLD